MMKVKKFVVRRVDCDGNWIPDTESTALMDIYDYRFDGGYLMQVVAEDDSVESEYYDEEVAESLFGRWFDCVECGQRHELAWLITLNWELYITRLCFDCHFWIAKVGLADLMKVVRVDHQHFVIGDDDPESLMKGFGGRPFRVYFFSGEVLESTNVWSQGDIPERFWDRLPDNARMVADPVEWAELQARQGRDENGMPIEGSE